MESYQGMCFGVREWIYGVLQEQNFKKSNTKFNYRSHKLVGRDTPTG